MTKDILDSIRDEVNVGNLFIKMGFFVRVHIQIFPSDSTSKVSDIDVYASKYDRLLHKQTILVEVKNDSCRISDLFKLYGFKEYFGVSDTYFVTDKINQTFMDISKSMNIQAISFSKLREISNISRSEIKDPFTKEDVTKIEDFLRAIKSKYDNEIFWKYHYLWLERNPYNRFFQIQRLFSKTSNLFEVKTDEISWLRKELFMLAFLACIDMASDSRNVDDKNIDAYIRDKFSNIGTTKEGKSKIKKGMDEIVSILKTLSEQQNQTLDLPKLEFEPEYIDKLIHLIRQLTAQSQYVGKTFEINDSIYRSILHNKSQNIRTLTKSNFQADGIIFMNDLLLRILHEGPIKEDFGNFV